MSPAAPTISKVKPLPERTIVSSAEPGGTSSLYVTRDTLASRRFSGISLSIQITRSRSVSNLQVFMMADLQGEDDHSFRIPKMLTQPHTTIRWLTTPGPSHQALPLPAFSWNQLLGCDRASMAPAPARRLSYNLDQKSMETAFFHIQGCEKCIRHFTGLLVEPFDFIQFNLSLTNLHAGIITPRSQPHLLIVGGGAIRQEFDDVQKVRRYLGHAFIYRGPSRMSSIPRIAVSYTH